MFEVSKMFIKCGLKSELFLDLETYNIMEGDYFPPSKQIAILEILYKDRIVTIVYEDKLYISVCPNNYQDDRQICECGESFAEVLASVVNSYWLLFSKQEQKEIIDILRGDL